MKQLLFLLLGVVIIVNACQTSTELTDTDKEAIVQAVKEVRQEYVSIHSSTYDNEAASKLQNLYDENSDQIWQTEPIANATGVRVRNKRVDALAGIKSMVDKRLSTPVKVRNQYFSVLSENKVLEILESDFTVIMKDSTDVGTYTAVGTTLWAKIDGEWKMQYTHSSYARQSE